MLNEEEASLLMLSLRELNTLAKLYGVKLGDRPLFQIVREIATKRLLKEVSLHREERN